MKTFKYKRWSGSKVTVEAQYVEFTPTHVVFTVDSPTNPLHGGKQIVLAERADQVNELREVAS